MVPKKIRNLVHSECWSNVMHACVGCKAGTVIGECHRRHRSVEFRKFLATSDAAVRADLDVHLILDN